VGVIEHPQEYELARRAAAQGWACRDTLSGVHIGGDGRLTWRVGDELWLTASHDADALGRENALLSHLLSAFDRSKETFTVPAPVPTADGDLTFSSDGFGWRVTRHISGRRPDDDSLDTYRQSANTLRRLHEILRLLPNDIAVAKPVTSLSRNFVEHALGSDWETVTDDPSERHDVVRMATWLSTRLDALDQVPHQLIHGDWATPNLLMSTGDPARIIAVLDWQFAMIGPAISDHDQATSTALMWSSFPNKTQVIREILDCYGDEAQSRLLGVAMAAFWFWNYWGDRELLQREPRAKAAMDRQPDRLRTVLAFAQHWEGSVGM
jgi:Ser/Thr protein kinase RdoA (MazF antagonist)